MVISKRVLSSARRVDQSGVRPRAGQGDRQSVTRGQGELALGLPSLSGLWWPCGRPRPCSIRHYDNQDTVPPVYLRLDNSLISSDEPDLCAVLCYALLRSSCAVPQRWYPEVVPRPWFLVESTPMGGREPAVEAGRQGWA